MYRICCLLLLIAFSPVEGAYGRYSSQEEAQGNFREVLVALNDLKHEVHNHETELRTFEEKFHSLEEIIDSLRNQVNAGLQAMRDSLKNHVSSLDAKFSGHEAASKGLTANLQQHASDSAVALTDYKKRIAELEKTLELQNRNIENLQTALKSLMGALEVKEDPLPEKIYRVKAGDSLEKIARLHKTTIKKLKELNSLTSDQIIVGQKLQLPE
jgi:LysM repeat protein